MFNTIYLSNCFKKSLLYYSICLLLQALLNSETFQMLPQAYQYKLITLLPECDKLVPSDNTLRYSMPVTCYQ